MKTFMVNTKEMLAEHKRIIPMLKKAGLTAEAKDQAKELKEIKKKAILKKYTGKGGMDLSPYKQVATPIDLLKTRGEPPTVGAIPLSNANSFGKR